MTFANPSSIAPESFAFPKIQFVAPGPQERFEFKGVQSRPWDEGWKKYIHPDGSLYFHNATLHALTEENIWDEQKIYRTIMELYEEEREDLRNDGIYQRLPQDWEVEIIFDPEDEEIGLLWVSHKKKASFRLVPGNKKRKLRYDTNETEYWDHVQKFPMHHTREAFPEASLTDFQTVMTRGYTGGTLDQLQPTFPFNEFQCRRILEIFDQLHHGWDEADSTFPVLVWHVARMFYTIHLDRVRHGPHDQQEKNMIARNIEPGPVSVWKRFLGWCMFILFFEMQSLYATRLKETMVHGVVWLPALRGSMTNFIAEWTDSNLLAIVFTLANIAFLTIPGVNGLQKTASFASTLLSMASILIGLHHIWLHRGNLDMDRKEANRYLTHLSQFGKRRTRDLTTTAYFLACPIVLLLWSVVAFMTALGAFCMQSTESPDRVVLGVVIGLFVAIGALTVKFFCSLWSKRNQYRKPLIHHV